MFDRAQEFYDPEKPMHQYFYINPLQNSHSNKANKNCSTKKQQFVVSPKMISFFMIFIFCIAFKIPSIIHYFDQLCVQNTIFLQNETTLKFSTIFQKDNSLQINLLFQNEDQSPISINIQNIKYSLKKPIDHSTVQWRTLHFSPLSLLVKKNQPLTYFYSIPLNIKDQAWILQKPMIFFKVETALKTYFAEVSVANLTIAAANSARQANLSPTNTSP